MGEKSVFDEFWSRKRGVSRLVVMVQDQQTLFVYWEVDKQRRALLSRHFDTPYSELPLFLRWHDVTDVIFDGDNAHFTQACPVHPEADNWYVRDLQPQRTYLADLVTQSRAGSYFTVLRSNVVTTPPAKEYRASAGAIQFMPPRFMIYDRDCQCFSTPLQTSIQTESQLSHTASTYLFSIPYPQQFDGYSLS